MKNEKNVKIIIIVMALLLSLFFLVAVIIINKKDEEDNTPKEENEILEVVDDYTIFFSVETNINQYIDAVKEKNEVRIYNLLLNDYLEENNITTNNILSNIPNYSSEYNYKASVSKSYNLNDDVIVYYSKGNIMNYIMDEEIKIQEQEFFLFVDYENMAIAIYPIDEDIDVEQQVSKINKNYKINENSSNALKGVSFTNVNTICLMYLSNYISLISNDIEAAYKVTNGFSTQKDFEKQIESKNLSSIITSCTRNNRTENRIYYVIDDQGNKYTFIEENIMNYSVTITK